MCYIFHLASYHGNQSSIADPIEDQRNNTLTTLKLCEHFKSHEIKKIVYASASLHSG
ncbi:NAD-dependent epimerase/dehydratase family protein [Coxiella-like endosymbiont of Rhipicephalus sanguineus]|uniref:NAD-dependent epimerase/dehydratase family protein n=1 Tax=Coxiella-like endosymbiont of Rhipicephalus sanguineus TaxID=1955402 RepID=UPI0035583058